MTYEESYDILATKMDKDYQYKLKLKEFYEKHGFIPDAEAPLDKDHHRESFDVFLRDRFLCWRSMPKVVKRVKRAAKRAAKCDVKNS